MLIHVIRCDNDRTTYPLISKRFYQLWLRAGLAAVFDKKNPLMQELTAHWKRDPKDPELEDPKGVDRLLQNVVMNWFFPKIAILPLVEFGDVSLLNLLKYRAVEELNNLHNHIVRAENEQLVAVARKFMEHSESAQFALRELDGTWPIEKQAEFVRDKFKNDRTISVQVNEVGPQLELFSNQNYSSVPDEILHLDVNPGIITQGLTVSAALDQTPFVAALLRSSKWNQPLVLEEIQKRFLLSISLGKTEFVKLFLESPCLSQHGVEVGFYNATSPRAEKVTHETRLEIIRLFLADQRISPDSEAVNLATLRAIANGNQNQAELLELIRLFLDYRRAANLPLPTDSLLMTTAVKGRSLANRLAVIDLLINDPGMSHAVFVQGLHTAGSTDALIQHDRLEVIRHLLTWRTAGSGDLGGILSYATSVGEAYPIEDRLALLQFLLAQQAPHLRISNEDVGQVFRQRAFLGRNHAPIPIVDLLLADGRVSDEDCMEAISRGNMYASSVSPFFLSALKTLLAHPSMTASRLWKCAVTLQQTQISQALYRQSLQLVAEHPLAAQMPIAIRVWLVFERAWGWLTSPLYAVIGSWIKEEYNEEKYILSRFKNHTVVMVAGGLLLPVTLFRAAISNLLDFIARRV